MAKEKVKLLIQTRLTDGKQVRVNPVLSRNTPKATKEGLWAVVDGKETPVQGTYVLRYRPQPRAHRVWESVGSEPMVALDRKRQKERELAAKTAVAVAGLELKEEPAAADSRLTLAYAVSLYLEKQQAERKAHRTQIGRKHKLNLFQQNCTKTYIDDITVADLEKFKNFLKGKYTKPKGARTIYNTFGAINTFLRAKLHDAEGNEIYSGKQIGGDVLKALGRQYDRKDVVAYTPEELTALFSICDEDDKVVFEFFLYSGFREGEVANLAWNQVNFHTNTVRIAPKANWSPKRKTDRRVIPLPAWLVEKLKFRLEARKAKPTDLVFPNGQGGVDGHLLRRLQTIAKDLPGHYELHKFRKTFASLYVHKVDIQTLRQWLGHTSLDITQAYIQCFMAEKPEAQAIANSLPVYGEASIGQMRSA